MKLRDSWQFGTDQGFTYLIGAAVLNYLAVDYLAGGIVCTLRPITEGGHEMMRALACFDVVFGFIIPLAVGATYGFQFFHRTLLHIAMTTYYGTAAISAGGLPLAFIDRKLTEGSDLFSEGIDFSMNVLESGPAVISGASIAVSAAGVLVSAVLLAGVTMATAVQPDCDERATV